VLALELAGTVAGTDGLVPRSPFVAAAPAAAHDVASPLP